MSLFMRLHYRRMTGLCLVVLLIGCSSEPAMRQHGRLADRSSASGPSVPFHRTGGWTHDTLAPIERDPDIDCDTMPGLEADPSMIDPHGDEAARIEQIEVCGFGDTGEKTVFLRVENSHKTARVGNCILGFVIVKIEAPWVTFEREGRLWKRAPGRGTDRKNRLHDPLIPADPPLFEPETAPESMALEALDPVNESAVPIDPQWGESEIDIEVPATRPDPRETRLNFPSRTNA